MMQKVHFRLTSVAQKRFWATLVNRKWGLLPFYLPWRWQICIAKFLFSYNQTTAQWRKKSTSGWRPSVAQKHRCLRWLMYRLNRSFNPSPIGQPPRAFDFFEIPTTGAKMLFKCPTLGSIEVIKCPHPGDISQAHKWQKDGRNAFSCRTKSL